MSRTHGWYPKPKYSTAGLKVSQEQWDKIFPPKKLSGTEVSGVRAAEAEVSDNRAVPAQSFAKISWDKVKLQRFKNAYERAIKSEATAFEFDGHDFYPPYAKYLIEYLEGLFHP